MEGAQSACLDAAKIKKFWYKTAKLELAKIWQLVLAVMKVWKGSQKDLKVQTS